MGITAVIPVRKGSVRVKNKNLKPFANSSLLEIKIKQLKRVSGLDKIVVSSDCEKMLSIASDNGVHTHVREPFYASSEATNSQFFKNLAESINGNTIMYSPVTCPLISLDTYRECIGKYERERLTNLVTVASLKHHMWLDGKPLNYKIDNSPNSQDLPNIYGITYGVCIIEKELMLKNSNIVTQSPSFYLLDEIESIDIDTEFDFMVAEMVYRKIYQNCHEVK
jgi:N-acylneuraminate cytidylyltransferase